MTVPAPAVVAPVLCDVRAVVLGAASLPSERLAWAYTSRPRTYEVPQGGDGHDRASRGRCRRLARGLCRSRLGGQGSPSPRAVTPARARLGVRGCRRAPRGGAAGAEGPSVPRPPCAVQACCQAPPASVRPWRTTPSTSSRRRSQSAASPARVKIRASARPARTEPGAMPAKVSVKARPRVTAGFSRLARARQKISRIRRAVATTSPRV